MPTTPPTTPVLPAGRGKLGKPANACRSSRPCRFRDGCRKSSSRRWRRVDHSWRSCRFSGSHNRGHDLRGTSLNSNEQNDQKES